MSRGRWRAWIAVGVLLGLALSAHGSEATSERLPWILVYVVDTFRYDDLVSKAPDGTESIAGAKGGFARLVRDGTLFERAFSTTSWTRPAVASLLTGLPPSGHGIRDFADGLRDGVPLLAERLRERGYRTVAVSSNPNVLPRWGFGRGFDRFLDTPPTRTDGESDGYGDLLAGALEAVRSPEAAPLFLYVHDNGPHAPYRATPAAKERFGVADAPPDAVFFEKPGSPEVTRQALGLHRAAVHLASERLANLIDAIEAAGRLGDAIVVLVGDHGDEFGEHGGTHHAKTLYQELLHVPLVVKAEALPGGRVSAPVSIADVAPSVASWVGASELAETSASRSLGAPGKERPILAELETTRFAVALVEWPWKYLRKGSDPGLPAEVYHLERDPGEQQNLADSQPEVRERLLRMAEAARGEALGGLTLSCVAGSSPKEIHLTLRSQSESLAVEGLALEPGDRATALLGVDGRIQGASLDARLTPRAFDRGVGRTRDRDGMHLQLGGPEAKASWVRIDPKDAVSQPPVFGPDDARLVPGRRIPLARIQAPHRPPPLTRREARPICRLHYYEPPEAPRPALDDPELETRLRELGYLE